MLGKLLKYELKATARYFVPLLATFGGITLLFKLFMIMIGFGNDPLRMTFSIFIVTIYVVAVIALFLMCFIISFYRFYKNFYTDEGYLSFTLPVSVNLQILSKLLISIFWVVISSVAFMFSILFSWQVRHTGLISVRCCPFHSRNLTRLTRESDFYLSPRLCLH